MLSFQFNNKVRAAADCYDTWRDHILTAKELKHWLFLSVSPVLLAWSTDSLGFPACELDNDQITGGKERVVVGPKLSGLSRDPNYHGTAAYLFFSK